MLCEETLDILLVHLRGRGLVMSLVLAVVVNILVVEPSTSIVRVLFIMSTVGMPVFASFVVPILMVIVSASVTAHVVSMSVFVTVLIAFSSVPVMMFAAAEMASVVTSMFSMLAFLMPGVVGIMNFL
jgi:hypothetical protein